MPRRPTLWLCDWLLADLWNTAVGRRGTRVGLFLDPTRVPCDWRCMTGEKFETVWRNQRSVGWLDHLARRVACVWGAYLRPRAKMHRPCQGRGTGPCAALASRYDPGIRSACGSRGHRAWISEERLPALSSPASSAGGRSCWGLCPAGRAVVSRARIRATWESALGSWCSRLRREVPGEGSWSRGCAVLARPRPPEHPSTCTSAARRVMIPPLKRTSSWSWAPSSPICGQATAPSGCSHAGSAGRCLGQ